MTDEQRLTLERGFSETADAVKRLFDENAHDALMRRPSAESWSAAENIAHLNLTASAMVPLMEQAVADIRAAGLRSTSPGRMGLVAGLLRWALEPPPRFRSRTTTPFVPVSVPSVDAVWSEFLDWHRRTMRLLREADGLDLSARKIVSPFDSRVRYNVFAALRIMETHARRHLWQAGKAIS